MGEHNQSNLRRSELVSLTWGTRMPQQKAEEVTVPYRPEANGLSMPFLVEKDNTELGIEK